MGIDENDGGDDNTYELEGLVDIDGCSEDDAMAGMLWLLLLSDVLLLSLLKTTASIIAIIIIIAIYISLL